MKDHEQDFAARLASLKPTKPSEDLLDRIARSASQTEPPPVQSKRDIVPQSFRLWPMLVALAAIVLVALTLWFTLPAHTPEGTNPDPISDGGPVPAPPRVDDGAPPEVDLSLPTAGNYHRAMRQSPEALDALLQEHADTLMPPTRHPSLNQLIKETSS